MISRVQSYEKLQKIFLQFYVILKMTHSHVKAGIVIPVEFRIRLQFDLVSTDKS